MTGLTSVCPLKQEPPSGDRAAAPLVSIVIPCYKGERYVAAAIESCLRQTYRRLEVIVVDDASPDDCAGIAQRIADRDNRLKVVRRPSNGGVAEAFNTGFRLARGEYLTRLAQDDAFTEEALECMVKYLEQNPHVGLAYCDYQTMDEEGKPSGSRVLPEGIRALSWRNDVGLCVMWRRAVWDKVGEFNGEYDTAEDYDYWLRAARAFSFAKCPNIEPLLVRQHSEMGSTRFALKQEELSKKLLIRTFRERKGWVWPTLALLKGLSYIAVSAASDYTASGRQLKALQRMVKSLALWPIPYSRSDVKYSFARLRLLAQILLRTVNRSACASPAVQSSGQPSTKQGCRMRAISSAFHDLREILSLPKLTINLMLGKTAENDPFFRELVVAFFKEARSRHPKFPLISKYRHGVATCVLPPTFKEHFAKIEASARRNFKKAQRNRYVFQRISFNDHLEDIAEIRRSAEFRQGKMPDEYLREKPKPCSNPASATALHDYPYFGVLRDGKLFAYAGCLVAGELCMVEHIFGHAQHQADGVVPMLLISIADYLLREHPSVKYYAYDTFFGASETMRRFKMKLGFAPYRVTWKLDGES